MAAGVEPLTRQHSASSPAEPRSPTSPPPLADLAAPFTGTPANESTSTLLAQPTAVSKLSLTDRLLLAQVVHSQNECPPNWPRVSNAMLNHPLIKSSERLKAASDAGLTMGRVFGSRECERSWVQLMRQYNLTTPLEESDPETTGPLMRQRPKEARGPTPRTDRKSQLALAQILYAEKMEELKESIKKKEEEFKVLIKRIDHLKAQDAAEADEGRSGSKVAISKSKGGDAAVSVQLPASTAKTIPAPNTEADDMQNGARDSGETITSLSAPETSPSVKPEAAKEGEAQSSESGLPHGLAVGTGLEIPDDSGDVDGVEQALGKEQLAQPTQPAKDFKGAKGTNKKAQGLGEPPSQQREGRRSTPSTPVAANSTERASSSKAISPQSSPAGTSKRNKRKREEQPDDADAAMRQDEHFDANDTPSFLESKRTRSSAITTPREDLENEEQGDWATSAAQLSKRESAASVTLLAPSTRRSRRGVKDGEETSSGVPGSTGGDDEASEAVKNDVTTSPTARMGGRQRNVPRCSTRARGRTTRSRETSAMQEEEDQAGHSQEPEPEPEPEQEQEPEASMQVDEVNQVGDEFVDSTTTTTRRGDTSKASRRGSAVSAFAAAKEREQREKRGKANQKLLMQIWSQVSAHKNANIFQNDVRVSDAPDYSSLILQPTSLKSIRAAIKDNRVTTITELRASLEHLFANAIMFNRRGGHNPVHGYAQDMRGEVDRILRDYEQGANGRIVPGGLGLTRASSMSARKAAVVDTGASGDDGDGFAAAEALTTENVLTTDTGRSSRARSRA